MMEFFVYHGCSMAGTLKPADLLFVERLSFDALRPGDVVVFSSQDTQGSHLTVHRIRSKEFFGFTTQGDANAQPDPYKVTPEMLIGRVVYVQRRKRILHLPGDWQGRFWLVLLMLARRFVNVFCWFYRFLRTRGFFQRLAAPFISRVTFYTSKGLHFKYLLLGQPVATWQPAQRRFTCRKPFDLFIKPPG